MKKDLKIKVMVKVVKISTNVPLVLTLVTPMLNVIILQVPTTVNVIMDGKVMVSAVLTLMNVLLVPMLVTVLELAPTPLAHTTAHVMMDIWVMVSCVLFHVLHSTIPLRMVT